MADRESRFRVVWDFIRQGDPQAIQNEIKQVNQTAKESAAAYQQSGQAAQQAAQSHQQMHRAATESAGALRQASDASYMFGMGAMYAGIPALNFVAISGNLINGLEMMTRGFSDALGKLTPLSAGLLVGAVAVTGLTMAMVASAKAADEMIGRVTKLHEVTGLSMGETARQANQFMALFGPEGAMGVMESISRFQANTPLIGMFQQLSAAGQAAKLGPGQVYMPNLQDQFAQFGLSGYLPGTTGTRPKKKSPEQVLFEVARDIASRQDKDLQSIELERLGPMVGGEDVLGRVVREMQRGQKKGQSPEQVMAGLQQRGQFGFTPTEQDQERVDRFSDAQNELALAFGTLKAELGTGLLPIFTGFIDTITGGVQFIKGIGHAIGDFEQRTHLLVPILQGAALVIGIALIPVLIGLVGGLFALLPAIGAVTIAALPWLLLFGGIVALLWALRGGAGETEGPLKALTGNLGAFAGAWKGVDFPGMAGAAKAWGDKAAGAFERVGKEKDKLLENFAKMATTWPIPITLVPVVGAAVAGTALGGPIEEAWRAFWRDHPFQLPVPSMPQFDAAALIAGAGIAVEEAWRRFWQSRTLQLPMPLLPSTVLAVVLVDTLAQLAADAWDGFWASHQLTLPIPALPSLAEAGAVAGELAQTAQTAWLDFWATHSLEIPVPLLPLSINVTALAADLGQLVNGGWVDYWASHVLRIPLPLEPLLTDVVATADAIGLAVTTTWANFWSDPLHALNIPLPKFELPQLPTGEDVGKALAPAGDVLGNIWGFMSDPKAQLGAIAFAVLAPAMLAGAAGLLGGAGAGAAATVAPEVAASAGATAAGAAAAGGSAAALTPEALAALQTIIRSGPGVAAGLLPVFSPEVEQAIASGSLATGLNSDVLRAVIQQESGGNPNAVSPVGAQGLMQLMPGTAAGLGVTDPFNIGQNVMGGAKFLKNLLDQFGDLPTALAAYNAGPGNVQRYGLEGVLAPDFAHGETQRYVTSIMGMLAPLGDAFTQIGDTAQNVLGTLIPGAFGQSEQAASSLASGADTSLEGARQKIITTGQTGSETFNTAGTIPEAMRQTIAIFLAGAEAAKTQLNPAFDLSKLAAEAMAGDSQNGLLFARDAVTQMGSVMGVMKDTIIPGFIGQVRGLIGVLADLPRDIYVTVHYQEDGLPGRASGGPVLAGLPYLVGEVGPEVFRPSVAGTIIPNQELGDLGRGAGTTVNVQVNVAGMDFSDPSHIERIARDVGDQIVRNVRMIGGSARIM